MCDYKISILQLHHFYKELATAVVTLGCGAQDNTDGEAFEIRQWLCICQGLKRVTGTAFHYNGDGSIF
jgi:hypothetical protein